MRKNRFTEEQTGEVVHRIFIAVAYAPQALLLWSAIVVGLACAHDARAQSTASPRPPAAAQESTVVVGRYRGGTIRLWKTANAARLCEASWQGQENGLKFATDKVCEFARPAVYEPEVLIRSERDGIAHIQVGCCRGYLRSIDIVDRKDASSEHDLLRADATTLRSTTGKPVDLYEFYDFQDDASLCARGPSKFKQCQKYLRGAVPAGTTVCIDEQPVQPVSGFTAVIIADEGPWSCAYGYVSSRNVTPRSRSRPRR